MPDALITQYVRWPGHIAALQASVPDWEPSGRFLRAYFFTPTSPLRETCIDMGLFVIGTKIILVVMVGFWSKRPNDNLFLCGISAQKWLPFIAIHRKVHPPSRAHANFRRMLMLAADVNLTLGQGRRSSVWKRWVPRFRTCMTMPLSYLFLLPALVSTFRASQRSSWPPGKPHHIWPKWPISVSLTSWHQDHRREWRVSLYATNLPRFYSKPFWVYIW